MPRASQRGFTYLGLIILLAIIGLVGAAGLKMGTLLQRAAAEEELLEIGAQFSDALRSYAAATPQGQPQQPPSLQELLKDPRFPNPRRHLRKIFVDPVTGKAEWGIIYLGDKVGVLGVHSLSDAPPLKIANFDVRFPNMENREKISDWKFLMAGGADLPPALLAPPKPPQASASLFSQPGTAPAPTPGEAPAAPVTAPPAPAPPEETPDERDDDQVKAEEKPAELVSDDERDAREAEEREKDYKAASEAAAAAGMPPPLPPPPRRSR